MVQSQQYQNIKKMLCLDLTAFYFQFYNTVYAVNI